MTPDELKAIKARCEAATEGPWRAIRDTGVRNDGGYVVFSKAKPSHYLGQDERYEREIGEWHGNLEFIAHARKDLPDCIAEIEQLIAALEDVCYQFGGWNDTKGGLTTSSLSALEFAFEVLGWDEPHPVPPMQCDEPGCKKQSVCGWPSPKGYRRTCSEHHNMEAE